MSTNVVTIIFVAVIIGLCIWVIIRYRDLGKSIQKYMNVVEFIIAYIEHKKTPDFKDKEIEIINLFNDYRSIIENSTGTNDAFIKFKRKNLEMQKPLIAELESCRTITEALPFVGILGTVIGLIISNNLSDITLSSFTNVTEGLTLALFSTGAALLAIIIIKLGFERSVIPQYIHFENTLQAIEDYGRNYGGIKFSQKAQD